MIGRTHDMMRDPLDRAWDAVVAPATSPVEAAPQDELRILRQFHALDVTPGPDEGFIDRLAHQLGAFEQARVLQPATTTAHAAAAPVRLRPDRLHQPAPQRRWLGALAAALAVLLAGALVLWLIDRAGNSAERSIPAVIVEATPGTPATDGTEPDRLLFTTFDPASIGATGQDEWTVALEFLLDIPAGETYRQNGPENGDSGISVVVVTTGTFDAVSSGPTLLYRAGERNSQDVVPNTPLSLSVGDAWITSMHDLVTAANTSGAPAEILRYAMGKPGDGTYFEFTPQTGTYTFAHDPKGPAWPDGPVTIDLQRIALDKDDSYGVEVRADESFLLVTSGTGAVRVTKDGSNRGASSIATSLGDYPAGAYTIRRDLSGSVDLYLARWTSAASTEPTGTSAADTPAMATLLNASVDPAAIDARPEASWNYSGVFPKTGLRPGQSVTLDATNWGAGLTVTQVLDGVLTLVAQGPAQVVPAGETVQVEVPAGTSITLAAGDAVFLDASHGAEFHNDSDADVSLLTFVAFDVPDQFFPDVAYPENLWGPLTPSVDLDVTQRFDGPVTVSFERVTLSQDQSIAVDVGENELVYFDTDDGSAVHFMQEGSNQPIPGGRILLHDKGPGTYTLTRLAEDPVKITIVRMRQADAAPPATIQLESLANLTFDPALLGVDATQSWTMINDFLVDLGPGETVSIGGELFDGGFFVTFPLSGSVELTTSRDALWSDRIGAEPQPLAPGATQAIAPGQVWAGAAATPIEIANRTDQTATLFIHSLGTSVSQVAGGLGIGPGRMAHMSTEDPDNQLVYAGEPVTVSVETVTLDHAEHYNFDLGANESVLLMTADSSPVRVTNNQDHVDTASYQRALHGSETSQTYTITRDVQSPVEVYLIRVSAPSADGADSP